MDLQFIFEQFSNFTTTFLGIFIEAAPFLLLGSLASGLVEVFVSRENFARLLPKNTILATLLGGVMGFAFPVCECGVVPLTRRLFKKGLPIPTGITFLLAAPILNPVVLASTFAAYGAGKILAARLVLGLAVAVAVGLVFSLNKTPQSMMLAAPEPEPPGAVTAVAGGQVADLPLPEDGGAGPFRERLQSALKFAGDDFFEMGQYLVIGSMLAALMQTVVPQAALLALGSGPVISVLVMQVLGYVLSVCSTVDAFVSLAFVNTFTTGSILSFLVFGPMVDIKSTLMFLSVFKRKYVAYLIALPFLMTMLVTLFINLYLSW